jgi:hypothetical protein
MRSSCLPQTEPRCDGRIQISSIFSVYPWYSMSDSGDNFPFDTPPPGGSLYPDTAANLNFKPGVSLARLVIGGLLLATDTVMDRLLSAEYIRQRREVLVDLPESVSHAQENSEESDQNLKYVYPEDVENARYALIGMLFTARDRLIAGADRLDAVQRSLARRTGRFTRPIRQSILLRPFQDGYDQLARRGEQEVNQWIEIGKREAVHSREIADATFHSTVDDSIEYLAQNPEVKELVQLQSTGLADEAVEEIRERAVSADNLIEGMVRHFLRRLPRYEIPPPPDDVRRHAERLHPERKK